MPSLTLYPPPGDGPGEPPAPAARPPTEPLPLQFRLIEQVAADGSRYTDAVLLWRNEDAARCRYCPAGQCNYQPTPAGAGTCVIQREGPAPLSLPATLECLRRHPFTFANRPRR
jgi:hypothetical protein